VDSMVSLYNRASNMDGWLLTAIRPRCTTRAINLNNLNLYFHKKKKPLSFDRGFSINSLTMSYFHTGTRTIIGAEAFHCPVRDGKGWDHLAMVIKLNRSPC
jgi:hypothetical protein